MNGSMSIQHKREELILYNPRARLTQAPAVLYTYFVAPARLEYLAPPKAVTWRTSPSMAEQWNAADAAARAARQPAVQSSPPICQTMAHQLKTRVMSYARGAEIALRGQPAGNRFTVQNAAVSLATIAWHGNRNQPASLSKTAK